VQGCTLRREVGGRSLLFQAEDGMRDGSVTGVQTCALPILTRSAASASSRREEAEAAVDRGEAEAALLVRPTPIEAVFERARRGEIGRAWCRGRVCVEGGGSAAKVVNQRCGLRARSEAPARG